MVLRAYSVLKPSAGVQFPGGCYNQWMLPTLSHRLKPLENKPPGQLLIHEIYRSIQGESTFAGLPCVLVRLAVCDAHCVWCDTPHAFNQGTNWTIEAVIERVLAFQCPLVEVTGGEPLLQEEVFPLMAGLVEKGLTVLLETSGAQRRPGSSRRPYHHRFEMPRQQRMCRQLLGEPRFAQADRSNQVCHCE